MLADAGISGNSNQTLVQNGQSICAHIAHGTSSLTAADRLRSVNPSLTLVQGNTAVDAALTFLCPQLIHTDGTPLLPMQ